MSKVANYGLIILTQSIYQTTKVEKKMLNSITTEVESIRNP